MPSVSKSTLGAKPVHIFSRWFKPALFVNLCELKFTVEWFIQKHVSSKATNLVSGFDYFQEFMRKSKVRLWIFMFSAWT